MRCDSLVCCSRRPGISEKLFKKHMPSELLAWEYALPSLSPIPTKLMIIQLHIGPQSVFLAYVGARVSKWEKHKSCPRQHSECAVEAKKN